MAGHINDMVSQHWNTPEDILAPLIKYFGRIDLDPCDNEFSKTNAVRSIRLPEDGLAANWDVGFLFINPPYGRDKKRGTSIEDWVKKAHEASYKCGNIVLLIPASTETTFWHEHIWRGADAVCFIKGRVAHPLNGKPAKAASTKGSALVYYGSDMDKFKQACEDLGKVLVIPG